MPMTRTLPNKEFARWLRILRAQQQITQLQMAERISEAGYAVSDKTISAWERTGAMPSLKEPAYAEIIAKAYGTTTLALYSVANRLDTVTNEDAKLLIKKIPEELLAMLDDATPEQLDMFTRVCRAIMARQDEDDTIPLYLNGRTK